MEAKRGQEFAIAGNMTVTLGGRELLQNPQQLTTPQAHETKGEEDDE